MNDKRDFVICSHCTKEVDSPTDLKCSDCKIKPEVKESTFADGKQAGAMETWEKMLNRMFWASRWFGMEF